MTKKHAQENYISNRFGIPAHDYIKNTYDVSGNLTQIDFYYGGLQDSGEHVAQLIMTYDVNDNLLTIERTI